MRRRGATFATDLTGTAGESERLLGPALGSRDDHEEGAAGDDSGNDSTKEQRKVLLRAASHRSVTTAAEVVHHLHRQRSSSAIPHVFPKHDPTKGTNLSSDHVDGGTPRVRRHSTKSDGGESEGKDGGDGEEDPTAYRINYEEHLMPLNELADLYQTEIDLQNPKESGGLKPVQAAELLKKFGANALTPPPRTPGWLLFAMQFTNLFMILLIVAALLSIIIYVLYGEPSDLYLGVILFIVVLATCYETYAQEVKVMLCGPPPFLHTNDGHAHTTHRIPRHHVRLHVAVRRLPRVAQDVGAGDDHRDAWRRASERQGGGPGHRGRDQAALRRQGAGRLPRHLHAGPQGGPDEHHGRERGDG